MVQKTIKVLLVLLLFTQMFLPPATMMANEVTTPPEFVEDYVENDSVDYTKYESEQLTSLVEEDNEADESNDVYLSFDEETFLTQTLGEPVGMQGFSGDYSLDDNKNEMIEIIVQFVTPSAVALRLMYERGILVDYMLEESFEEQALAAHKAFNEQLAQLPILFSSQQMEIISMHYQLLNGAYMNVPVSMVELIADLPEVFKIEPHILPTMPEIHLTNEENSVPFSPSSFFANEALMRETREFLNIDYIHQELGITGRGVRVAIIDGGIDHSHPEFARFLDDTGRVPGWQHFYQPGSAHPHGTITAGALVAMAPEIELWSIQRSNNQTPGLGFIPALEAARSENVDIVYTWDHAGRYQQNGPFTIEDEMVTLTVLEGIVVVAAVHNDGPNSYTIQRGANSPLVIAVGAGTAGGRGNTNDTIAAGSGRGPLRVTYHIKPDIIAPGVNVYTTRPGGGYTLESGTSLASPVITGITALLVQEFPNADPSEIRARLMNSSRELAHPTANRVFDVGAGFVRPFEALTNESFVTVEHLVPISEHRQHPFQLETMASLSFGNINSVLPDNLSTMTATVTNTSNVARTYTIEHVFTNNPNNALAITSSRDTLTVAANSTGYFTISTSFRGSVPNAFYEGYIYVREDGNQVARLPFAVVNSGSSRQVNAHTLNFNLGGTSSSPTQPMRIDSINIESGTRVQHFINNHHNAFSQDYGNVSANGPRRAGYNFVGWYLDANFQRPLLSTTAITNTTTLYARWQPVVIDHCTIVAEGRLANQPGTGGMQGALWTLCDDGTLEIREGFINSVGSVSPWINHQNQITRIHITGRLTAGTSLNSFFRDLEQVTEIQGLELVNTSNVTNMDRTFRGLINLTTLDVSSWDTSRVTNMNSMFSGMWNLRSINVSNLDTSRVTNMSTVFFNVHSLTELDLSDWDTRNVTTMVNMFVEARVLSSLTLGRNFRFVGTSPLPSVRATNEFTGMWQNVGTGTAQNPNGHHVLTSAQLISQYNGATMADTWVWQRSHITLD